MVQLWTCFTRGTTQAWAQSNVTADTCLGTILCHCIHLLGHNLVSLQTPASCFTPCQLAPPLTCALHLCRQERWRRPPTRQSWEEGQRNFDHADACTRIREI
jgi:hypothetical protein